MHKDDIQTKRLILRSWKKEDLESFAKLNADPRVMEYYPSIKSYEESKEEYNRHIEEIKREGFGFWAVSVKGGADFIGSIGLRRVPFTEHFTPAIEIGWRLAFDQWGNGYATEGALASLEYGFKTIKCHEIVAYTSMQNMRSRAVMKRIGMQHNPKDDFDHPKLAEGHRLRRHVLYRIKARGE